MEETKQGEERQGGRVSNRFARGGGGGGCKKQLAWLLHLRQILSNPQRTVGTNPHTLRLQQAKGIPMRVCGWCQSAGVNVCV